MKTRTHFQNGLSLIEILIVLAIIALGVLLLLPALTRPSRGHGGHGGRIRCVNNLRQVGLAYRIYAGDHEDSFPWMVSTNSNPTNTSGSREFAGSSQVFRHFQAASNELNNPAILRCPSDESRRKAQDFATLDNTNLSYFIGLDAIDGDHQMLLSGDRNITGGTLANSNLLLVRTNSPLAWTETLHVRAGNAGLADGSVQQLSISGLNQQVAAVTNTGVRLAIP